MSLFVTLSTSAALYSSLKLWFDVPFAIVMRFPKVKGNPKEIWFLQLSQWMLLIAVLCRSYFLVFLWARNVNRCLVLRLPLLCHMTLVKTEQQMEAFTFNASLTTTLFLICSVSCSFGENSAHSWICPARAQAVLYVWEHKKYYRHHPHEAFIHKVIREKNSTYATQCSLWSSFVNDYEGTEKYYF